MSVSTENPMDLSMYESYESSGGPSFQHVATSCEDLVGENEALSKEEMKLLQEDLAKERLRLQNQQCHVERLEKELAVMEQLKQELVKEKELRRKAEEKLFEVLEQKRKMELLQSREQGKSFESKSTQKDYTEINVEAGLEGNTSPLLLGYESRVRRYQAYIAKLEKDNLMLINELKKFKDMSPRSQEEQAKTLASKLSQLEKENHQQQIQYETCLDEVANRLVQTLLVQKRLEEECKVLHLRVEQLEQENHVLLQVDKNEVVSEAKPEQDETPPETTSTKVQKRIPSYQHPAKTVQNPHKMEEKHEEVKKSTNPTVAKSEPKVPVSPLSKSNSASKIPSFGTRPNPMRKKSKSDLPASKSSQVPKSPTKSIPSPTKNKFPDGCKAQSVKRKRLSSRNSSPLEKKGTKSTHIRWDQKVKPEETRAFCNGDHVWSFNCSLESGIPESSRKVADSIDSFDKKEEEKPGESVQRTKDEGYSTMSSDLQPETVSEQKGVSDDSVTECIDGSMCSSSDSGFGPLHQVSLEESVRLSPKKHATVRHKDQIASVKPTVRIPPEKKMQSLQETISSELKVIEGKPDDSLVESWPLPKDVICGRMFTKSLDDKVLCYNKHSEGHSEEKVETAEKATLTEPEEELWREKALAPFIDESIWSLYSSESDIQVKHFPLEPLQSLDNLDLCIIVSEDLEPETKSSKNSSSGEVDNIEGQPDMFRTSLERVASDTVLYLKGAVHELEDAMHRGLKPSKNIPELHQSSESETSPFNLKPELIKTLESTMMKQNQMMWPSPSRSSSLSSLQSSTSYHVISDETDDVDMIRTSRKGSQDPDLSSDAEYENLEHKDFVERWLQKEMAQNPTSTKLSLVSHLEPVEEVGEYSSPPVRRKFSTPPDSPCLQQQNPNILTSTPISKNSTCINSSPLVQRYSSNCSSQTSPNKYLTLFPREDLDDVSLFEKNTAELAEEGDYECVDSEAKEFNGDFYKLCTIGSAKSLDLSIPTKAKEVPPKNLAESPINKKQTSKHENSKPTGFVKPTRPASLAVSSVPTIPEHTSGLLHCKTDDCKESKSNANLKVPYVSDCDVKKSDSSAKIESPSKVPQLVHHDRYQKDSKSMKSNSPVESSSQIRLPSNEQLTKTAKSSKSPTKIIIKSNSSISGSPKKLESLSKRQQMKRDMIVSRQNKLKEGCGTAWIHLQVNSDLNDPSARINLLDSIKAPTSSSGSSSTEDEEEVVVIQTNSHLHRICRERRQRVKASANNPLLAPKKRSYIVGRPEIFYRFGDKEKEAIACFDFLEDFSISSSVETLNRRSSSRLTPTELDSSHRENSPTEPISLLSPGASEASHLAALSDPSKMADRAKSPFSSYSARRLRLPNLWNQPLSHNMSSSTLNSQECEILDHISLSDSCAESYSSTPDSYEDAS